MRIPTLPGSIRLLLSTSVAFVAGCPADSLLTEDDDDTAAASSSTGDSSEPSGDGTTASEPATTSGVTSAAESTSGDTASSGTSLGVSGGDTSTTGGEDSGGDSGDTTGGGESGSDSGSESGGESTGAAAECGNGIREGDEACDGSDFGDAGCPVIGTIGCTVGCELDLAQCTDTMTVCSTPGAVIDAQVSELPLIDSIEIDDVAYVADVNVRVDITHPNATHVGVRLVPPAVEDFVLLSHDGPYGYGYGECYYTSGDYNYADIDATFDDELGVDPACNNPSAYDGPIRPQDDLATLEGSPVEGTWALEVYYDGYNAGYEYDPYNDGTLNEWCLELTLAAADPVTCGDDSAGGAEECDGADLLGKDCTDLGFASGTLACVPGSCQFDTSGCVASCGDDRVAPTEACDDWRTGDATCMSEGFAGGPIACNGCALDTSGCSNDVVAVCLSPPSPIPIDTLGTQTQEITVPNDIVIGDVDVFLDVSHPYLNQLDFSLARGATSNDLLGQGWCQGRSGLMLTFDDEAPNNNACNDWPGHGNRATSSMPPTSGGLTAFDGVSSAGTWTLSFSDSTAWEAGGTLNEWCVFITEAP